VPKIRLCKTCQAAPVRDTPAGAATTCQKCFKASYTHRRPKDTYRLDEWSEEAIQILRAEWRPDEKGNLMTLSRRLGYTPSTITRRAFELGLRPRQVKRFWTKAEEEFLAEHAGSYSLDWIADKLHMSTMAVRCKAHKLRLRMTFSDGYNTRDLAEVMGVSDWQIRRWVDLGKLKYAKIYRRSYIFDEAEIVKFMMKNPLAFTLAKVDQAWFMDIMTRGGVFTKAIGQALRLEKEFDAA
jgi:hypothetical protein